MLVGAKAFAVSINRHLIAVAERLLVLVVAVHVRVSAPQSAQAVVLFEPSKSVLSSSGCCFGLRIVLAVRVVAGCCETEPRFSASCQTLGNVPFPQLMADALSVLAVG